MDREHEMITTTDGYFSLMVGCGHSLWNRLGKGFVYSSKFTNQDDAERMFREHTGRRRSQPYQVPPRKARTWMER